MKEGFSIFGVPSVCVVPKMKLLCMIDEIWPWVQYLGKGGKSPYLL